MSLDGGGACRLARRCEEGESLPLLRQSRVSASMDIDAYIGLIWVGFGLGGLLGLIQATASPSGWLWTAIRVLISLVWLTGITGWLAAAIRERRSHRRRSS
jgi:uncharacterized protein (DUF983 family)